MRHFLVVIFGFYFGEIGAQIGSNPGGPPLSCDGWMFCDNSYVLQESINRQKGNYKLVFYDEFEGDNLDTNKWFTYYPYGENRDGTSEGDRVHGESQVYWDPNVIVKDGVLHLLGKKENVTWFNKEYEWTSGLVNSKIPFTTYGKFEAFCKIPCGKGWFAAFWLFGWGTEIDVFETHRDDEIGVGTINWVDGRFSKGIDYDMDFCNGFHKYSVEYSPLTVTFYVDDLLIYTVYHFRDSNGCGISQYPLVEGTEICKNLEFPRIGDPVDVILNLAVGGPFNKDWLGKQIHPDKDDEMLVDWIRVFQKDIQPNLKSLCISEIIGPNDICELDDTVQFCILEPIQSSECIWNYPDNFNIINLDTNCIAVEAKSYGLEVLSVIIPNQIEACDSKISKYINVGIQSPEILITRVNECENMKYLIGIDEIYADAEVEWNIESNLGTELVSDEFNVVWDVNHLEYELDIALKIRTDCGVANKKMKLEILRCSELMNICSINPNPVINGFVFKINNFDKDDNLRWLKIFSLDGILLDEIIPNDEFDGQLAIDVSTFSSGSYILRASMNNFEISKLFVISQR